MAELFEMPFGMWTRVGSSHRIPIEMKSGMLSRVGPGNCVLDGSAH